MKKREALKKLIADNGTYFIPGIFDCIGAKAAEEAGFALAAVSGNAVAASAFGLPDLGLITMSEVAEVSSRIAASVSIPVIADADTGYGQPLNFMRTVRSFEQKGIAGLHVEDQISPKKCAYYGGLHEVVPVEEQLRKLKAGLEAREDENFCIIARTDARVSFGLEEAEYRANKYLECGADAAFVVGLQSMDEIERLSRRVEGPLMIIINDHSPLNRFSHKDFSDLGIKFVLYAASLRCTHLKQSKAVLAELKAAGNTAACLELIATAADFQNITDLKETQLVELKYSGAEQGG